jgi:hypothetical protein
MTTTEHLHAWIKQHIEPKPNPSNSMTYFVSAELPWRAWMLDAQRDNVKLIREEKFAEAVRLTFPGSDVYFRSIMKKDGSIVEQRLLTGVRYYTDHIGGDLRFGV